MSGVDMSREERVDEWRRAWHGSLLLLLLVVAFACRAIVVLRTVAPDRDTANYVAMAQDFRAGDWSSALAGVFPPLHPLLWSLVGPLAGPSNEDWWFTGQILCVLLGVLSVGLLWRVAALFVTGLETALVPAIAAFWLAAAMLPAWNAADAMSEGLFLVLLCYWLLAWARERLWLLSFLAGLCFLTRPEGAILFAPVLWLLIRPWSRWSGTGARRWLRATLVLLAGLLLPLAYVIARARITGRFEAMPVGSFMHHLSVFSEPGLSQGIVWYVLRLLQFLIQGFDGLGYLAFPALFVAFFGLWSLDAKQRRLILPLVLTACVACLVVPLFKSNRRFWITWLPILLPLAARPIASLARFGTALHMRGPVFVALLVLLFLLPHMVRLPRERRAVLRADKALAHDFRDRGVHRGDIASDLPRFLFFADQDPLPPRRLLFAEFQRRVSDPRTKFVVILWGRGYGEDPNLEDLGYRLIPRDVIDPRSSLERPFLLYSR